MFANGAITAVGFSAVAGATPRVRGGMLVSANYFQVLGVEPQLGRAFRKEEDDVAGRDAVVVLGPDFWKSEFAGDPAVVGRTVLLNGIDFTVIGVAPRRVINRREDFPQFAGRCVPRSLPSSVPLVPALPPS